MEKRNSQLEHRQPMEQTRGLFCMCDSGVARCQSQHQCHFLRIKMVIIMKPPREDSDEKVSIPEPRLTNVVTVVFSLHVSALPQKPSSTVTVNTG